MRQEFHSFEATKLCLKKKKKRKIVRKKYKRCTKKLNLLKVKKKLYFQDPQDFQGMCMCELESFYQRKEDWFSICFWFFYKYFLENNKKKNGTHIWCAKYYNCRRKTLKEN